MTMWELSLGPTLSIRVDEVVLRSHCQGSLLYTYIGCSTLILQANS